MSYVICHVSYIKYHISYPAASQHPSARLYKNTVLIVRLICDVNTYSVLFQIARHYRLVEARHVCRQKNCTQPIAFNLHPSQLPQAIENKINSKWEIIGILRVWFATSRYLDLQELDLQQPEKRTGFAVSATTFLRCSCGKIVLKQWRKEFLKARVTTCTCADCAVEHKMHRIRYHAWFVSKTMLGAFPTCYFTTTCSSLLEDLFQWLWIISTFIMVRWGSCTEARFLSLCLSSGL